MLLFMIKQVDLKSEESVFDVYFEADKLKLLYRSQDGNPKVLSFDVNSHEEIRHKIRGKASS